VSRNASQNRSPCSGLGNVVVLEPLLLAGRSAMAEAYGPHRSVTSPRGWPTPR
jgi:hypothetical protein